MRTTFSSEEEFEISAGIKHPELFTLPKPEEFELNFEKKLSKFSKFLTKYYLEESGEYKELIEEVKKKEIDESIFAPLEQNRRIKVLWDLKTTVLNQLEEYKKLNQTLIKHEKTIVELQGIYNQVLKKNYSYNDEILSLFEKIEFSKKTLIKTLFLPPSFFQASNDTLIYERVKNVFLNWKPNSIYPKQWENTQSSNWEVLVKNVENFYAMEKNIDEFNEYDITYFLLTRIFIFDLLAIEEIYKTLYESIFGVSEGEEGEEFEELEEKPEVEESEEKIEESNEELPVKEIEVTVKHKMNDEEHEALKNQSSEAIRPKIQDFLKLLEKEKIPFNYNLVWQQSGIKKISEEFKKQGYNRTQTSGQAIFFVLVKRMEKEGKVRKKPNGQYAWQ